MHDLVETSAVAGDIRQSDEIGEAMLALRGFMFERVYLGDGSQEEHRRAAEHGRADLRRTSRAPRGAAARRRRAAQRITDYVAGMTDRYALAYAAAL